MQWSNSLNTARRQTEINIRTWHGHHWTHQERQIEINIKEDKLRLIEHDTKFIEHSKDKLRLIPEHGTHFTEHSKQDKPRSISDMRSIAYLSEWGQYNNNKPVYTTEQEAIIIHKKNQKRRRKCEEHVWGASSMWEWGKLKEPRLWWGNRLLSDYLPPPKMNTAPGSARPARQINSIAYYR
jgi:hypothetical protein